MPVKLIIGSQWGDEGKAKIIDYLAHDTDIVIRYQGGANAGHTVKVKDKSYVFHLIPSGILYSDTICILGAGMVINPDSFLEELKMLSANNIDYDNRIFIADNAHILLPYHSKIDALMEDNQETLTVGTTKKGIGSCYSDKVNRTGIRLADLLDEDFYTHDLPMLINEKKNLLKKIYNGEDIINLNEVETYLKKFISRVRPYLIHLPNYIHNALAADKNILLEGAQGNMLDLDYGTYPYVTSSNPTIGGAMIGSSIPYNYVNEVIGITKAYTTRVGQGPFPTELTDTTGDTIRKIGHEYGSTTGRPRRCGWFDIPIISHAKKINGITSLALTKIDVLDSLKEIHVATHYDFQGKKIDYFPSHSQNKIKPIYKALPGWQETTSHITNYDDLPQKAKDFIKFIEDMSQIKIQIISVGPKRSNTIQI